MIIVEAADDTTEEERKADGSDAASDAAAQERLTDTFTHLSSDMQELLWAGDLEISQHDCNYIVQQLNSYY